MMSNPIYVGVPPYQRVISDEIWIRTAVELIKEQGPEQFLVNMLYMLRTSMVEALPGEAVPDDYDGPLPAGDSHQVPPGDDWLDHGESPSPWHSPMEGFIYCSHDDLPMLVLGEEFVCIGEYLAAHIDHSPITDLITEPTLALVFQNGHTLALLCPDCGDSLHISDHNVLLDEINGLTVVEVDWDEDLEELLLGFGRPGSNGHEEQDIAFELEVHLDSVRNLTCPYLNSWHDEDVEDPET
jgi:hypothetical protein